MDEKNADSSATQNFKTPRLWRSALVCALLLMLEIYALVYDIGLTNIGETLAGKSTPAIATLREGVNDIRKKQAGTITWRIPLQGDELNTEDSILTLAKSKALVAFNDGAELLIDEESLVVLEKPIDANAAISIKLVQGTLSKSKEGTLPFSVDVDGKRLEDATGNAKFRLSKTEQGYRVSVEKGELSLGDGANVQKISADHEAVIENGKLEVKPIEVTFRLFSPNGSREIYRDSKDERVSLRWETRGPAGIADKRQKVRLAKPDKQLEFVPNSAGNAVVEIEEDGEYSWNVEVEDETTGNKISNAEPIKIVTRKAPEAILPEDDSAFRVRKAVAFRFKPVANAGGARTPASAKTVLEISSDEDFSEKTEYETEGNGFNHAFKTPGTYFWRLKTNYGETGGLSKPSETRSIEIEPKRLLPAPRIRKTRVRLQALWYPEQNASYLSGVQKDPPKAIAEIEWEIVDGATAYKIEISDSESFEKVLFSRKMKETRFSFRTDRTPEEKTLYYRVASVDDEDEQGPFGDTQEIEIPPISDAEHIANEDKDRVHFEFAVGAAYHSREFKNSDSMPKTVAASGFVPAACNAEVRFKINEEWNFDVGTSAIVEKGVPTTLNVIEDETPLLWIRAWAMAESFFGGEFGGIGLYGATSNKFSWSGRHALNERKVVMGAAASWMNSPFIKTNWHWRAQLGAIGVGALGADLALSLKRPFLSDEPVAAAEHHGPFLMTEVFGRYLTIETSYGGLFKIGYAF